MQTNTQVVGNTQLSESLKIMEKQDKALIITLSNKYITAKRSCGDVNAAFNEFMYAIKDMEIKYGFKAFDANAKVIEVIDDFAAKIELATNTLLGGKTYTCEFNSIAEANNWLALQNNLVINHILFNTSRVGLDVNKIRLEYTLSNKPTCKKYRITEEMKIRFFVGTKEEKFRQNWKQKNPNYNLVHCIKRKWGFSLIGGSVGFFRFIKEKYIILYTFNAGQ